MLLKKKIDALKNFVSSHDTGKLLSVYRRIGNIIDSEKASKSNPDLFKGDEEKALYNTYLSIEPKIQEYIKNHEYESVFEVIASLKDPLSNFFDNVLVNDDDSKVAENRKALLHEIYDLFEGVANFKSLSSL